jgi:hypothetical protein
VGQNAIFSPVASGSGPLSYQWKYNGASLAGATNQTLALTNILKIAAGNYALVVTNSFGSITSSVATLTLSMPSISLSTVGSAGLGLSAKGFGFQFSVPVGSTYVILASTDLHNWTPISTNIALSASVAFTDSGASNYPGRFYRVMAQ